MKTIKFVVEDISYGDVQKKWKGIIGTFPKMKPGQSFVFFRGDNSRESNNTYTQLFVAFKKAGEGFKVGRKLDKTSGITEVRVFKVK